MVHEIIFQRIYTPSFLPLKPDDIVVDIGANIGVFSVYAASLTQNMVYAFEPMPSNVEFLRRNAQSNGLGNIAIHEVGVDDKTGTARLYQSTISGGHRLFDHYRDQELDRFLEVPTTTLPQIMDDNGLEQVDFVKMDCEGSEGPILASTPIEYLRRIMKIAMEFHDDASEYKHDFIDDRLQKSGFGTTLRWDGKSPYGFIYGRRA
jgi:FkbM family methyltransferase